MSTMRQILRPGLFITFALTLGGAYLLEVVGAYTRWIEVQEPRALYFGLLLLLMQVYGVYRVIRFHPRLRPGYAAWLRSLPWSPPDPLPLGPVHLVWVDALVFAVLGGLTYWIYPRPLTLLQVLPFIALGSLTFYSLALLLGTLRQTVHVVIVAALLPLLLYPQPRPLQAGLVMLAIYLVLWHAHRRDMAAFPLEPIRADRRQDDLEEAVDRGLLHGLYIVSGPEHRARGRTWADVLCKCALAAWWAHVIVALMADEFRTDWQNVAAQMARPGMANVLRFFWTILYVFLFVSRLWVYLNGHLPPTNWRGRLLRGRLIIPGYDVVFIAPACLVAFGLWGPMALQALAVPPQALPALSVFVLMLIALGMGPSRQRWQWLAPHRLVVPMQWGKPAQQRSRDEIVLRLTFD
jgi:hypothetical protein